MKHWIIITLVAATGALSVACSSTPATEPETAPTEAAVVEGAATAVVDTSTTDMTDSGANGVITFTAPVDGASVASPVEFCIDAKGITIEPKGEVKAGSGHHHLIVDATAAEMAEINAGTPIILPADDTHIHMGDGSTCTTLELAPGEHSVMAVVGDGVHTNLNPPVVAEMTITVE